MSLLMCGACSCQYLGQVARQVPFKLNNFFSLFTEQKKQKLSEVKAGLDEAESLVSELFSQNGVLILYVKTTSN